jgi:hypothetical protein
VPKVSLSVPHQLQQSDADCDDPYHSEAPIAVSSSDFELAWLERDYSYALVTPQP